MRMENIGGGGGMDVNAIMRALQKRQSFDDGGGGGDMFSFLEQNGNPGGQMGGMPTPNPDFSFGDDLGGIMGLMGGGAPQPDPGGIMGMMQNDLGGIQGLMSGVPQPNPMDQLNQGAAMQGQMGEALPGGILQLLMQILQGG